MIKNKPNMIKTNLNMINNISNMIKVKRHDQEYS